MIDIIRNIKKIESCKNHESRVDSTGYCLICWKLIINNSCSVVKKFLSCISLNKTVSYEGKDNSPLCQKFTGI